MPVKQYHTSLIILVLILAGCGQSESTDNESQAGQGRIIDFTGSLTIIDRNNNELSTLDIAIADNETTRSLGLMDVRELKADGGMLFIFDQEVRQNFWMANTPLPLDLIFANSSGEIVHIHQRAQPFSRDGIDSVYPSLYVLEVNAGYTLTHDIQVGHFITYTN